MDLVDLEVDLGGFSGFGGRIRMDLMDLADLGGVFNGLWGGFGWI